MFGLTHSFSQILLLLISRKPSSASHHSFFTALELQLDSRAYMSRRISQPRTK